jgi:hypothetical protein
MEESVFAEDKRERMVCGVAQECQCTVAGLILPIQTGLPIRGAHETRVPWAGTSFWMVVLEYRMLFTAA